MMKVYSDVLDLYSKYGHQIRTGLNPHYFKYNFAPFTSVWKNDVILGTGGGISPNELHFLEYLFSDFHPKNIFCIGNAFGWSSLIIALLNPQSRVLCIDAGIEGKDNLAGIHLTNLIATEENLNLEVINGMSPIDTGRIVKNFNGKIDFVFIDGLHTNNQLLLDFQGVLKHCNPGCIYLFHDVVLYDLIESFKKCKTISALNSRILYRTDSGMGVLFPHKVDNEIHRTINTFCQDHDKINALKKSTSTLHKFKSLIFRTCNKFKRGE